jgi:hypothetical protein
MGNKVAIGLAAAALVVAVFGSTSAGRAALDAVIPVPLAKRAYLADTAKNAIKVNNIKASRTAAAGMLLPLDATGKFPVSVGAIGPVGPTGDKGKNGSNGATNVVVRMSTAQTTTGVGVGNTTASCNQGERAVGGGAGLTTGGSAGGLTVTDGKPVPQTAGATPTGWNAGVKWTGAGYTWAVYVICASP